MLRAVLGELVQTTDGKWITHPPTAAPTVTRSARTKSSSAMSPASATAAGTPPGHAAHAIRRCTGRRSTPTAAHWRACGGADLDVGDELMWSRVEMLSEAGNNRNCSTGDGRRKPGVCCRSANSSGSGSTRRFA